jgi:SAM-dependent methyltransferase
MENSDSEPQADDGHAEHMAMNSKAWDAYQPAYMDMVLKAWPNFFEALASGATCLDDNEVRLAGDVTGLTVLDVCCSSQADEAFSWENLGANVIACDLSPVAIEIAKASAERLGSHVHFVVADSQELAPIESQSVDLVYGRYLCWFEDIGQTMRTWFRVLRPGGKLLVSAGHPIKDRLEPQGDAYVLRRSYDDESPEYYDFDGTPMADEHGGWHGEQHPAVEFFHPTWRVVNAIVDAGFRLMRMEEHTPAHSGAQQNPMQLPHDLMILAEKHPTWIVAP